MTWLPASDVDERTVLSQLAISLFGTGRRLFTGSRTYDLGVEVSPSEHAALEVGWEVYRPAFVEARKALVLGFCFKHGLYASEGGDPGELSEESRASMQRALSLAEKLPDVQSPIKRVASGPQE